MAGGPLAKILSVAIPEQGADRIAAYLRQIAVKLNALDATVQRVIAQSAEKIDLIEEGGLQSTRALSEQRISQILEAVVHGLAAEEADVLRRKRLLVISGELDDDEIALLNAYGRSYGVDTYGDEDDHWSSIQVPAPVHIGSSRAEMTASDLFEAGRGHLERLGLLSRHFPFLKRGQMPEFDSFAGDFKHILEISQLGRLLCTRSG